MRAKPLLMICALALWNPACGGSKDVTPADAATGSETSHTGSTEGEAATGEHGTGAGVAADHGDERAHDPAAPTGPSATGPEAAPIPRDGILEALPERTLLAKLRPSARRQLASMLRTQRDGRFPPEVREDSENARLFLVAAMNEEASDTVRVAALDGMSRTWSSSVDSGSKMIPDEDFVYVVRYHLRSENPRVLAAALKAATRALPLSPPDTDLIRDLVILGFRPDPATQFVVLEALPKVNDFLAHEGVEALMLRAIDSREPFVAAKAIMQLGSLASGVKDRRALREALERAAEAGDPGVRGRALRLLAGTSQGHDTAEHARARALCMKSLDDSSAYVRSSAAAGLGNLQAMDAVPALEKLLGDDAVDVYDLQGWTQLDGTPGFLHHDGSMMSRVDDAALDALAQVTASLGDAGFRRHSVGRLEGVALLDRQREDARAWIKANRAAVKEWTERARAAREAAASKRGATEAQNSPEDSTTGAPAVPVAGGH